MLFFLAGGLLGAGEAQWSVDFDRKGLEDWHLPLPNDWRVADDNGNKVLRLQNAGPIGDPRRPVKFALWKPGCVSDFEAEVKMRRRGKSLLVAFGFQDRLHFYYAHVSSDDGSHQVHNGLFKVDGGERFRIGGTGSRPALPTRNWHAVRVVRRVDSGKMELFIDGETEPRFSVVDKSFQHGWVGVGSFDETGDFDDFHLTGTVSDKCREDQISPLDR